MALITCPECKKEISSEAESCPNCGYSLAKKKKQSKSTAFGIGCLAIVLLFIILAIIGSNSSSSSTRSSPSSSSTHTGTAPVSYEPKLELESWNWHTEYGYAIAEGTVKNISEESLENVSATVSFLTSDGTFITSSDALIEYNPILPNQVSPFKVMATENPAMRSARVEFKYLMGGTIPYKKKESRKK